MLHLTTGKEQLKARSVIEIFCVGTVGDICVANYAIDVVQADFKNCDSFWCGAEHCQVKKVEKVGIVLLRFETLEVQEVAGL